MQNKFIANHSHTYIESKHIGFWAFFRTIRANFSSFIHENHHYSQAPKD